MGEKKRRERNLTDAERAALIMTRRLMSEGKLIEGGWHAHVAIALSPDMPADELMQHRFSYYAGAEHLWSSIMSGLDPGKEPTAADDDRMNKIHAEITRWRAEAQALFGRESTSRIN